MEYVQSLTPGPSHDEARAVLVDLAHGHAGKLPREFWPDQALRVTEGADWPVQRAALLAILRRVVSSRSEDLRVASRPARGAPFGDYTTRRKGQPVRPYRTALYGLVPLAASCGCRDFLRNALGMCKHVAAVLDDLAARPRRLARSLEAERSAPPLFWDPVRPLTGPGDWLAGVRRHGPVSPRLERAFDGEGRLHARHLDDPARRAALLEKLARSRPVDPALAALLERERSESSRVRNASRQRARLRSALRSLRRPLYPYQREGVTRALEAGSFLLGDDMGLGKTAQAIAICHARFAAGSVRRGLLVVPASLKSQWVREWHDFTDTPIEVVEGSPAQRETTYATTRRGFLVTNYELVLRDLELIRAWAPDLVVLDEAQRIKNWATKTAAYVKSLQPPYRLVLTGTPMENRLDELASIFDWVDDRALEPKWRLAPWHSVYADGTAEVVGARNLDTLRRRIAPRMLRRIRREVLDQLPPRTDSRIPIELTDEQRAEHDALDQPIAILMRTAQRRPLTQAEFLRLMQLFTTQRVICNGLAQLRFPEVWPELGRNGRARDRMLRRLDSPKLLELREVLAQLAIEEERKVVVFSQWRRMLTLAHYAIGDLLDRGGLRAAFFTGAESSRRRTQNLVDFHDDPKVRVLFCTDAGGVGLNLQRAADCCVNLELPWNPAVLEQRIGRIHRLGQERPIDVYHLIAEDGIEGRIASLVRDKRALFDGLFDGDSDQIRFDGSGSFLERLQRLVTPHVPPGDDTTDDEPGLADVFTLPREVEPVAPEQEPESEPEPAPAAPLATALAGLRVTREHDGSVRIDAPPEAAETLAGLLRRLADLVAAAPEDPHR